MEKPAEIPASTVKAIADLFIDLYARVHVLQQMTVKGPTQDDLFAEKLQLEKARLRALPAIAALVNHADLNQLEALSRTLQSTKKE